MINTIVDSTVCENAVPFTWNGQNITGAGTYTYTTTSAAGCDSTTTLNLHIADVNLIITDPASVCNGETVDITLPGITAGSDQSLTLNYWMDASATIEISNPKNITTCRYILHQSY